MSVVLDITAFWEKKRLQNFCIKKIVGIDYGTCKLGVAITDENCMMAFPDTVLVGNWSSINTTVEMVYDVCRKHNTNAVVIGFPKKPNGDLSDNCKKIIEIANLLDNRFLDKSEDSIILLFDERFTTKAAMSFLNSKNTKCNNKKYAKKTAYDDDKAACVLLNNVINCQNCCKNFS